MYDHEAQAIEDRREIPAGCWSIVELLENCTIEELTSPVNRLYWLHVAVWEAEDA